MAGFSRLDRMISATVDRTVSDGRFRLTPMAPVTPNRPMEPDPERAVVEGVVVFSYLPVEVGMQLGVRKTYREGNDFRAIESGRDPYVSIDRKCFASVADEPKKGDLIDMLDLPELPGFKVVDVQRDGQSRVVLKLVQPGGQA